MGVRREIRELKEQVSELRGMLLCGTDGGHVITLDNFDSNWDGYNFKCVRCAFSYSRAKKNLNEKEKALVEFLYGKKKRETIG